MMQYDITNSQILIFSVIDTSLDNVLKSLLNLGVNRQLAKSPVVCYGHLDSAKTVRRKTDASRWDSRG
jgi:hypothetical protein